jgi:hypothetical protein
MYMHPLTIAEGLSALFRKGHKMSYKVFFDELVSDDIMVLGDEGIAYFACDQRSGKSKIVAIGSVDDVFGSYASFEEMLWTVLRNQGAV